MIVYRKEQQFTKWADTGNVDAGGAGYGGFSPPFHTDNRNSRAGMGMEASERVFHSGRCPLRGRIWSSFVRAQDDHISAFFHACLTVGLVIVRAQSRRENPITRLKSRLRTGTEKGFEYNYIDYISYILSAV